MSVSYQEAQQIIDNYLDAYPGLKSYMSSCDRQVCLHGFVKTKFGRIRHLPLAKELFKKYGLKLLDKKFARDNGLDEIRWKFKNMLNLAKNFPIQGVAAHTVNRAAIAINRRMRDNNIEGCIVAQVHDELTVLTRVEHAEAVKQIMKECMETTTRLSIPLKAEPLISDNWAEAK